MEYFMSFPTEIKSIHCNAIWVWHPGVIFVYLFVETGGKQVDLSTKLKLDTQNFKQFVGEHPFCVVTEDILSAIVFSTSGMWLEEIRKPLFCANSLIRFAISLQRAECMPPILLMYANAVPLSVKICTCLTLKLRLTFDFRANKMVFSSKILKWFLSKEFDLPPIGVFPSVALNSCSPAPAWIVQSTGISCNDWFAFLRCLNHQYHSATAEVLRGIKGALYLPFWNLSQEILHLSNSL